MNKIHLMNLDSAEHLVQPEEFHDISMDSSALTIFTDFKQYVPQVIDADTPVVKADYMMKKAHLRLLLVIDHNNELIGTISLQELDDQSLQILHNKGIERKEMVVRDLMIPRSQQKVVDYQQLMHASVTDVLGALQESGALHCLVVDQNLHQIRGIISAAEIARRLHASIDIETPLTFIDIFKAVNGVERPFMAPNHVNLIDY